MNSKTIYILLFGVTMAVFESAVVVYLRELYYPGGFSFPLKLTTDVVALTELCREFASLVMILSVAVIATKKLAGRFAWFLIIFAVWDIFYYVFLKIFLDWPESLLTWDILFLLPVIWSGPVLSPVIASFTMIVLGFMILWFESKLSKPFKLSTLEWWSLIGGAAIVFVAFIWDFVKFAVDNYELTRESNVFIDKMNALSTSYIPHSFNWYIFLSGMLVILYGIYLIYRRNIVEIRFKEH